MSERLISIAEWSPLWLLGFEVEEAAVAAALGRVLIRSHHIGSTAIQGLAAKPIIDVLLEVSSLAALDEKSAHMVAIGYDPRGENGISRRRYYTKGGVRRTHHVHAFEVGDLRVREHLVLRDYLRLNPEIARQYGELKQRAAIESDGDPVAYGKMKFDFVERHKRLALGQA